jgi:CDP-diacylglycerol pyrophosphatase
MMKFHKTILAAAVCLAGVTLGLSAGAKGPRAPSKEGPELKQNMGRDALRDLVQNQCLINWRTHHDPAPCERIVVAGAQPDSPGYAVVKDRESGAHYLLVPLKTMSGTESAELLDPDLPNFFAEAWSARDLLSDFVGHAVPRTAVGLALNTSRERDQNQFHLHIECLRPDVAEALRAGAANVTSKWSPITVAGSTYQAMRVTDTSLDATNPFELVAKLGAEVRHHIEDYTLLVAGMQYADGAGFAILAGTGPRTQYLLDPGCAVAGGGG